MVNGALGRNLHRPPAQLSLCGLHKSLIRLQKPTEAVMVVDNATHSNVRNSD